jgi:DmsE family decaheme c-type cytochrome
MLANRSEACLAVRPILSLHLRVSSRKMPESFCLPLLILCMVLLPASARAAGQSEAGSCTKCHAAVVNGFAESPHGTASTAHDGANVSCANCHGDAKAHAAGNSDTSAIQNPAKLSAKDADARCLACHSKQHPDFARSAHAASNIGCTSCHSIHAGKEGKLLKAAQPALCNHCHSAVESEFSAPVHHTTGDGPIKCTTCHDPHAAVEQRLQVSIAQQVSTCFKCHTDVAGPWVYEHKAINQTGCMACHTPHGGKNPKLLSMANVNNTCLQCHLPSATQSDAQTNAAHTPGSTKPCTDCHAAIHGSNHEKRFGRP